MPRTALRSFLALVLLVAGVGGQSPRKSADFIFEIQPSVITAGEPAVLRWSVKGATKVVIEEVPDSKRDLKTVGTFGGSGSIQVNPKENTTYVITCEGSTTISCASISVRVRVKPRN